jgi:prepilin-type N-terminal cleavage/methylation domain-containing protein
MRRNSVGLTLIELMVVIVLLGIIIGTAVELFSKIMVAYRLANIDSDILSSYRVVITLLEKDIRNSEKIVDKYGQFQTSTSCVVLLTPSIDADREIIPGEYDRIIYYSDKKNPKNFIKSVMPSKTSARSPTTRVLINNLDKIEFVIKQPVETSNMVTYSLAISRKAYRLRTSVKREFNNSLLLRNYHQ